MKTIQTEYFFENFKYSNDGVIHKIENNFLKLLWIAAVARQQILIIKKKTKSVAWKTENHLFHLHLYYYPLKISVRIHFALFKNDGKNDLLASREKWCVVHFIVLNKFR